MVCEQPKAAYCHTVLLRDAPVACLLVQLWRAQSPASLGGADEGVRTWTTKVKIPTLCRQAKERRERLGRHRGLQNPGGGFGVVDYEYLNGFRMGLELQAQLFFKSGEKRGAEVCRKPRRADAFNHVGEHHAFGAARHDVRLSGRFVAKCFSLRLRYSGSALGFHLA